MAIYHISELQLKKLRRDVKSRQQAAYASGTKNNIKTQWKAFIMFCLYFNIDYLPCSNETVCLYIQFLSRSFKSVQSIKNYVSGVRNLHLLHGYEFPDNDNFELRLLLRGSLEYTPHTKTCTTNHTRFTAQNIPTPEHRRTILQSNLVQFPIRLFPYG